MVGGLGRLPARMLFAGGCLTLLVTILIGVFALEEVPLSGDEGAYVYQADLFAHGQLAASVTPIQPLIAQSYIFPLNGKLVSQYPPGWSAVLAAAEFTGLPLWVVNPIIGAVTLLALWRFTRRQHGREVAAIAVVLVMCSAFFLFNSASYYNGPLVALLGILFAEAVCDFLDRPGVWPAIGMGLWFSAIAVTRHFDAILFAAPAAVVLLKRVRAGTVRYFLIAAAAATPLLAVTIIYYVRVTGILFATPQTLRNPADGLLGGNWHAMRATELLAGRVVELAEWVSPLFDIALAWAWIRKALDKSLRFYDFYPVVFLCGYWLYWSDGGFRWGPRYIYPAFPFMAVTIASFAWPALQRASTAWFARLVAICMIASAIQVPFLVVRARQLVDETQDVPRQIRAAGLHNAVVVVVSGTGTIWTIDIGDLARNGLTLDRDVVLAHGPGLFSSKITPADIARAVDDLRAYFPGRDVWLYYRNEGSAQGRLVKA